MKLISQLKLKIGYNKKDIIDAICKKCTCSAKSIYAFHIVKESIDARKGVIFILNVAVEFNIKNKIINALKDVKINKKGIEVPVFNGVERPVIVGFGPSGMFCGLSLAKMGLKPIILEQGKNIEEREKDVQNFWNNGNLLENSNVHYGEGGAGTFSDGKLNTNANNEYCKTVINEFIKQGAPQEIFYKSKPHIGTDNLKEIVRNIRYEIIKLGGEIIFNAQMVNFSKDNIEYVEYLELDTNEVKKIKTNRLILGIGHSPLKTFELLKTKNVELTPKVFAMGVRIEQPQININNSQYGVVDSRLPNADYKLVEHLENGRSVFTFCMCPGGYVVASSSEKNGIVTNGMSNFARNSKYANSAVLVNVLPQDYFKNDVLDGFYYQRHYENLAFKLGGSNYNAPAQSVAEFLGNKKEEMECTYRPNVKICDISKCLPDYVSESIRLALPKFNNKIKNFTKNAMLFAIESRSSCPVTINRNENFISTKIKGLYPIGEGAGYAGGIITSAVDGLKCAICIQKELEA